MSDEKKSRGAILAEHAFRPGQSGNPSGRARGSRNKLGEAFLSDLFADWQEHGVDAIRRVREERPQDYLKVTASLLPKQIQLENLTDLSDDDLNARIKVLAEALEFELPRRPAAPVARSRKTH